MVEAQDQGSSRAPLELIEERLRGTRPPDERTPYDIAGVSPEDRETVRHLLPTTQIPAAVLMPIVDRPSGPTLLFTQRAPHLRRHAGQISFPGGRIEAQDQGPLAAALRETEEEIGLRREYVRVLGYLPPQMIFTGYCVSPVVAVVKPGFELRLDTNEVAGIFEAPLAHILDPLNHHPRERQLGELSIKVYDIAYGEHRIWGATAGMVMSLRRLLQV